MASSRKTHGYFLETSGDRAVMVEKQTIPLSKGVYADPITSNLGDALPHVEAVPGTTTLRYHQNTNENARSDPLEHYTPLRAKQRVPSSAVRRLETAWREAESKIRGDKQSNHNALRAIASVRFPDPRTAAERYLIGGWPWSRRLVVLWATTPSGTEQLPPLEALKHFRQISQTLIAGSWIALALALLATIVIGIAFGPGWWQERQVREFEGGIGVQTHLYQAEAEKIAAEVREHHTTQKQILNEAEQRFAYLNDNNRLQQESTPNLTFVLGEAKDYKFQYESIDNKLVANRGAQAALSKRLDEMDDRVNAYIHDHQLKTRNPGLAARLLDEARQARVVVGKSAALLNTSTANNATPQIKLAAWNKTVDDELHRRTSVIPSQLDAVRVKIGQVKDKCDDIERDVERDFPQARYPDNHRNTLKFEMSKPDRQEVWVSLDQLAAELNGLKSEAMISPATAAAWKAADEECSKTRERINRMRQ